MGRVLAREGARPAALFGPNFLENGHSILKTSETPLHECDLLPIVLYFVLQPHVALA